MTLASSICSRNCKTFCGGKHKILLILEQSFLWLLKFEFLVGTYKFEVVWDEDRSSGNHQKISIKYGSMLYFIWRVLLLSKWSKVLLKEQSLNGWYEWTNLFLKKSWKIRAIALLCKSGRFLRNFYLIYFIKIWFGWNINCMWDTQSYYVLDGGTGR